MNIICRYIYTYVQIVKVAFEFFLSCLHTAFNWEAPHTYTCTYTYTYVYACAYHVCMHVYACVIYLYAFTDHELGNHLMELNMFLVYIVGCNYIRN